MCCLRKCFPVLRQVCSVYTVVLFLGIFLGILPLLGVPDNQVFELSDYIWSYLIEKSKVNFEKH